MPYLSLMIDSSDMPFDASSAESGRTADAPGALPRPPTSFVGRQHELADARRLLAHNRLLTLTGPGGCGKTRLSIELAAGVADEYPDGVHFVSLAGITDPALVPRSIAQGVGLQDSRGRPLLEHLSSYVRDRTLLLVLDNFEHLTAGRRLCRRAAQREHPTADTRHEPFTAALVGRAGVPGAAAGDAAS